MPFSRPTPRDNPLVPPGQKPGLDDSVVIPLHARSAIPSAESLSPPLVSEPRRPSVPLASRPWRLLVVPPTPDAPTRAFDIKRWQAKLAVWGVGALILIAVVDVVAVVVTVREQQAAPSDAEVAAVRDGLIALEDSLTVARASLAEAEAIARDSIAALGISANRARVAQLTARRRALLARGQSTTMSSTSAALDGDGSAIEGLPVIGAIASGFSYARKHPLLHLVRPHLGIDVAARYGSRITAPAAGRVTYVGRRFSYGLMVEIEHPGGITTRYAHCSAVLVKQGQSVARGALIATVGSSGLTTGPHLHYEILLNGHNMDPARFHFPAAEESAAASASGSAAAARDPRSTAPEASTQP